MEDYIRPSQIYEWVLNNLHTFSSETQEKTLDNLKTLRWVKEMIERLSLFQKELFKHTMMLNIDNPEMPFDLMSISAIIYNLRLQGINVTDLEEKVNTSERVINEIKKDLKENYLKL